jgi:hypothetical protein
MATSVDAFREIKITKEEEREVATEWLEVFNAINDLKELAEFYKHKETALRIARLIESNFASAHLWSVKVRVIALALEKKAKSISKELTAVEKQNINVAKLAEQALHKEVELAGSLYAYIKEDRINDAEKIRVELIKLAEMTNVFISELREIESKEEKIERQYF